MITGIVTLLYTCFPLSITGRGRSSVEIISPSNQTLVDPSKGPIVVEIQLTDFILGRDGSWCLIVCGRVLTCPQRDNINLSLDIQPSPISPVIIGIYGELRSNMYLDIISRSKPVYLFVPASDGARREGYRQEGEVYSSSTSETGELKIVYSIDVETYSSTGNCAIPALLSGEPLQYG